MSSDISNKAVLILAVLTIVISVLGTFTVLTATHSGVSPLSVPIGEEGSTSSGVVSLRIAPGDANPAISGQVVLGIHMEG